MAQKNYNSRFSRTLFYLWEIKTNSTKGHRADNSKIRKRISIDTLRLVLRIYEEGKKLR